MSIPGLVVVLMLVSRPTIAEDHSAFPEGYVEAVCADTASFTAEFFQRRAQGLSSLEVKHLISTTTDKPATLSMVGETAFRVGEDAYQQRAGDIFTEADVQRYMKEIQQFVYNSCLETTSHLR